MVSFQRSDTLVGVEMGRGNITQNGNFIEMSLFIGEQFKFQWTQKTMGNSFVLAQTLV